MRAFVRNIRYLFLSLALAGIGFIAAWAWAQRRHPAACPYGQRFALDFPRLILKREALSASLAPQPGERLLEIGPGTGYYSLDVASRLGSAGQLDALDLQQPMLDELMRRAEAQGIANIVPTRGDAAALPYPDATFDGVFLVATLGEVPEKDQALREMRRVLKPGGRLVVGEGQPDPHMVGLDDLLIRAQKAGLRYERHTGGRLGYLARFEAV